MGSIKRHATVVASVVLISQTLFYYCSSASEKIPAIAPWSQFPAEIQSWKAGVDFPIGEATLAVLQPDDYLARNYAAEGDPHLINLFVGYFNSRRNGRAPHSPEWCLPGAGWKSVSSKVVSIPIPNDTRVVPANEYLIEKGKIRKVVYYWYHQGSRTVASDVVAQLYSLPDLIFHGRTDTALVRVIVPVEGDDLSATRAVGFHFVQAIYPLIRKHIT